jgi:hypothetical protein
VFALSWTPQDEEDLRWYLEDYPTYTQGPTLQIAKGIEKRLMNVGDLLHQGLFPAGSDAERIWKAASDAPDELRIEIATEIALAGLPWELMRDPSSQMTPAKAGRAFVRLHPQPARSWAPRAEKAPQIRVLLVICRPRGATDVPFRSVASHLIRGLRPGYERYVSLEVLRPPTYEQLSSVLRQAARTNRPFQIVHFDGHGFSGGIEFENPDRSDNSELIAGAKIGGVLGDNRVPLLVLNACRSAFARPQAQPVAANDIHEEIRSFGSLAQAVADQGVPGVVAMRYNVFVETAARFMLDFYNSLGDGNSVGEAVNDAREHLSADSMRDTFPEPVELEDWLVPVSYEMGPVRFFAPTEDRPRLELATSASTAQPLLDVNLPRRPDAGFLGRDETLLALDRAFDRHQVVLLHAFAGSGKTATASEFARWYSQTGGIKGPVLFDSFAAHRTLPQLLERCGRRFEKELEKHGVQWPAIADQQVRRDIILQILRQDPRTVGLGQPGTSGRIPRRHTFLMGTGSAERTCGFSEGCFGSRRKISFDLPPG